MRQIVAGRIAGKRWSVTCQSSGLALNTGATCRFVRDKRHIPGFHQWRSL
ncbi:hypothetical protein [Nitrosomonas marina]|nr:hypothetical protein [Nitrosomonas marina]